jgi:hypothetical protein
MAAQHNYLENIVLYKGELRKFCKSAMVVQHNYFDNILLCKGELI